MRAARAVAMDGDGFWGTEHGSDGSSALAAESMAMPAALELSSPTMATGYVLSEERGLGELSAGGAMVSSEMPAALDPAMLEPVVVDDAHLPQLPAQGPHHFF